MGTRGDISRALRVSLAAALAGGCIDFVEPVLPSRGAPAVLEATVLLREPGSLAVAARLVPGLDAGGVGRRVRDDRLHVLGADAAPDSVSGPGVRFYNAEWSPGETAFAGPIEVRGPALTGLGAPPAVRWYTIRRSGAGEVMIGPGADLPLPIELPAGSSAPEPAIRQWFLTLSGGAGVFRLSADGLPPATIHVPARWVPAGDSVRASLIYQQSTKIEAGSGEYVGLISLDTRFSWTVRRAGNAYGES